ncbi:MAG: T9SS type A sorting domain-containing protein [Bacteroidetes bacterium]|nr:T9SS type A sorting domain-containing protein [Bacteroidota bacterium]
MKKNSFILFLFCFFISEGSYASHAVGADLTYVCLGGNNYRFFFTLYRDCQGIAVNPSYSIAGTSTWGASVNIIVSLDSTNEIIRFCPSVVTKCINLASNYLGIQANYYHGDITLPSVCNYWTFGMSPAICNRSALINDLFPYGASYCLYVEATLNNAAVQCNNSPAFSNVPVAFLCANQIQYFNQHAFDIDHDSLNYLMYTPHSDPTTDVQYIPGLSGSQPVTNNNDPTQFNTSNGEIRFHADNPQVTVVAVRVSDYRNGVLIGSVERDIQLIFESCNGALPNPPTATGINGAPVFSTHVCYDSLLSFQILTQDLDSDSTFVSWDHAIQGGLLTNTAGLFQSGIFSWTPDSSSVSARPYVFTLTVRDNSCPVIYYNSYSYEIFVDGCDATSIIVNPDNLIQYFSANYSSESHSIHFKYALGMAGPVLVSVYDVTGRLLKVERILESSATPGTLDAHDLSPGMYLLNLKTGDGISESVKVVID